MIKNYVKLNEQFNFLAKNVRISSNAQTLFRWVFDGFNTGKWPDEIKLPNSLLYRWAGFSRKQLERAREELIELGVLSYLKRNGATGSVYIINDLENLIKIYSENATKQTTNFFSNTKKCDKTNTLNATKQTNETAPLPPHPQPYISNNIENKYKSVNDYYSRISNTECENAKQECESEKQDCAKAKSVVDISVIPKWVDFEKLKKAISKSRFLKFKWDNNPNSVLRLWPKIQREPNCYDDYRRQSDVEKEFALTRKYSEEEINALFDNLDTISLKT